MTHPIDVAPGTIVIYSDMSCPFAHVAIHRLFTTRQRLELDEKVHLDHHAFPIELLNQAPGTRHGSDSEVPTLGTIEPDAGWQIWQGPDYHYPSTMMLAFEAVAAAKSQGLLAAENLDRALRRAFWSESRPIHLHHEIIDVARTVGTLDADALDTALWAGTHRAEVFTDLETASTDAVSMSPHLFLPDGTDVANPGLDITWHGDWARGFPIVERDDPTIYDTLLRAAASV